MTNKRIPLPIISDFRHKVESYYKVSSCILLQSFLLLHLTDESLVAKSLDHPDQEGSTLVPTGIVRIFGNPNADCAFVVTSNGEVLVIRRNWDGFDEGNGNSVESYIVEELETCVAHNTDLNTPINELIQATPTDKISLNYASGLNIIVMVLFTVVVILNLEGVVNKVADANNTLMNVASINCVNISNITSVSIINKDLLSDTFYSGLETSVRDIQHEVVHITIWGTSDQPYLVCIGKGAWILFIPLDVRGSDVSIVSTSTTNDDVSSSTGIRYNLNLSAHRGAWLSVLSESFNNHVSASGDTFGHILIWSMPDNRELLDHIKPIMRIDHFTPSAISALYLLHRGSELIMWIGDSSGAISSAEVAVKTGTFTKVRRIGLRVGTIPTEIQFLRIPGEKNLHKLLSLDKTCGLLQSIILHDSVASVFNAWPERLPLNDAIQACCVLNEHEILVTAGHGKELLLWDIASGRLLSKTISPDAFFTCLVCFDSGSKNEARIYSGHRNGKFNIYEASLSIATRNRSGPLGLNPLAADSIISISLFDILEGSVENSSLSDFLPPAIESSDHTNLANGSVLSSTNKDDASSVKTESSTGDLEMECVASLLDSKNYCPLPVTRLIVSALGKHIAICFSSSVMVVHKVETNEALAKAEFGDQLVEICPVSEGLKMHPLKNSSVVGLDELHVLLVGRNNIEVIDALTSNALVSFNINSALVSPHGSSGTLTLAAGAAWDLGTDSSFHAEINGSSPIDRVHTNFRGFFVSENRELFAYNFKWNKMLSSKLVSPLISADSESLVDHLIMGIESFDVDCSPITTLATFRGVYVFRMYMETCCVDLSPGKITEYVVYRNGHCVRVVYARALPVSQHVRMHRILIVLSDGTASVINL